MVTDEKLAEIAYEAFRDQLVRLGASVDGGNFWGLPDMTRTCWIEAAKSVAAGPERVE